MDYSWKIKCQFIYQFSRKRAMNYTCTNMFLSSIVCLFIYKIIKKTLRNSFYKVSNNIFKNALMIIVIRNPSNYIYCYPNRTLFRKNIGTKIRPFLEK